MPDPSEGSTARRPRGRRSGGEDTRDQILEAARAEFAEHSYGGASVRGIARRAGVDPALVRYWFEGGKAELLYTSLVHPAINPEQIARRVIDGPAGSLGARLVEAVLGAWDVPGGPERFRLMFAAAATGQAGAIRDYLAQEVFAKVATRLSGDDALLRVNLAASHLAGLMVARYLFRVEPLASTPLSEIVRRAGPVIQRYIDDPVGAGGGGAEGGGGGGAGGADGGGAEGGGGGGVGGGGGGAHGGHDDGAGPSPSASPQLYFPHEE